MADAPLVFSIARLATPSLELGLPDRYALEQDLVHDGLAVQRSSSSSGGSGMGAAPFASRVQADAEHPAGGTGGGLLKLPQAFGSVYLGQAFAAIVTACNFGAAPLGMVGIKVELATDRSRLALLYDSSAQPLLQLQPGQRHDFVVRHDIKDLGAHSLTCTATYVTLEGERRQQVQAFSFAAANPLVVRTKQRHVGEAVLLEAALENATRDPMLLDAVTFLPSSPYTAERIGAAAAPGPAPDTSGAGAGAGAGPLSAYIQALPLIPVGGSTALLFRLTKGAAQPPSSSAGAGEPPLGALGKIEIRWRGPMGQMARLQTQLISLPPQQGPREVGLSLARLPQRVVVGAPFTATFAVTGQADRRLGPIKLALAGEAPQPSPAGTPPRLAQPGGSSSSNAHDAGSGSRESSVHAAAAVGPLGGASPALLRRISAMAPGGAGSGAPGSPTSALAALAQLPVCLDGAQEAVLPELAPHQQVELSLRFLALAAGRQALPALALVGQRDLQQLAVLPPTELFVDSA